ncbi:MAG: DUF2846 domain-containing protein [Acetobacteraceae bacterium]
MNRRSFLAVVFATALLGGCATGPRFTAVESGIPALAPSFSRVWFYRSASYLGSAIQPTIYLNGKAVGYSVPGGFFFADTKPGTCEVSTSTEATKTLTFECPAGAQTYVRTRVYFGVLVGRVYPDLVDPVVGQDAIQTLHFTGRKLSRE